MTVEVTCGQCGRAFTAAWRPSRPSKYCSLACSGAAKTEAAAERRADPYEQEWLERRQDQRVDRWLPILGAGAQTVRTRDRHGHQVLWERFLRIGDPQSFFTASLARIAELEDALSGERSSDERGEAA